MSLALLRPELLFFIYTGTFALAAAGCMVALFRIDRVNDAEVRYGLSGLLLTSAGWAAAHLGYLVAPTTQFQHFFYVIGLVIGFAAVGPWLYFCSAYTGRSLHRNGTVRLFAVIVYLAIVAVKVTNPVHGWYYSTSVATEPFPHLLISHEPLHWVVMAFAYALAFIGFFMLFELFLSVDFDVTPLAVLVGITGLPVITDIVGFTHPLFLEITYSPLGVAVFAIGVMFTYLELFERIRLVGSSNEPAIILDEDGRIREFNRAARERFPTLEGTEGEPLSGVLPSVVTHLEDTDSPLRLRENGGTRYYHVTTNSFSGADADLGRILLFSDVTEREQYRHELERQNERLEQFASLVSHDLRNPLNVASLQLDTARRTLDGGGESESLEAVGNALERMEVLIDDLLTLARQGQPIDETETVPIEHVARQAWNVVETGDRELHVRDEYTVRADPERVQQLFENLFRNSVEHGDGASVIRIGQLEDGTGFFVEDDGVGIPEDERDQVLEYGYTTATGGTGFGLAIVAEIVDAHQWDIAVAESPEGGARFEIRTGV